MSELAKLLHRLAAVLDQDSSEMLDQCIDTAERYIDMWKDTGLGKSVVENISHEFSITALPDLPFADFEDGETDYDTVMDILDNVKNDAGKLTKIWSILSLIFWSGGDIPSDKMEQLVGRVE